MPHSSLFSCSVTGVSVALSPCSRPVEDDLSLFSNQQEYLARLKKSLGLGSRRLAPMGLTTSDLCACAAVALSGHEGRGLSSIDALIAVTQTPDYPQPCNAAVLHGRLGLSKDCACFDVNLGCSGYVYGLWLAHLLLGQGSGVNRVLLLAGDTVSQLCHPEDRAVSIMFGDAGSATLLERDAEGGAAHFITRTDGQGKDCLIVPAGGARHPRTPETGQAVTLPDGSRRSPENLFMDGAEVFNFSIREVPSLIREVLQIAGVGIEVPDVFLLHQANKFILDNIAKRLRVPMEKMPSRSFSRYGNTSSASVPLALVDYLSDRERSEWPQNALLAGFGVGLSWAGAFLSLKKLACARLIEHP